MRAVPKKPRIADADLLLFIRAGEKQGAELLYDMYANFLFLAIRRIVPQREVAEEVLQASFKKIWFTIDDYVLDKERIYTWMIGIARNLAIEAALLSEKKI